MLTLKIVETAAEWKKFIALPWDIYAKDSHWVPPLKIAVRDLLDVQKNPFFKHAFMHAIMAYRGDQVVGRVVGIVDENHNRFHNEKTAFFGFLEMTDDPVLCRALMDDVAAWAKKKGMKTLRGPMNPSINHECGLLVDGFNDSPTVMMTYNPPYYGPLLEAWGLVKSKDLLAYEINGRKARFSERLLAQAERLKAKGAVKIRIAELKNFDRELEIIQDIYNDAWEGNWGFVPMNTEEFRHLAQDLKMILDPRLVFIAEVRGQPAGFALALPDVNQVFKKVKDGQLFPTGLAQLLWNLKGPGRKKTINRCRIVTLGIKRQFRELGIGPLLYTEYFKRGPELGYPRGEASWILEDNGPMNKALQLMCGERTKVYRIYDRAL